MNAIFKATPVRRNLKFNFDFKNLKDWNTFGPHSTNFFNTLSVFFPEGEQFFIDSVRHYRDLGVIKDEELLADIRNFIGQEAMHGREHRDYNAALTEQGFDADKMERFVAGLLDTAKNILPASSQLAITCALEHMTATFANALLSCPEILDGADPIFADAWRWHALEETEHKAVAYEVYQQVMGSGAKAYSIRSINMLVAMSVFWPLNLTFWIHMNRRSGGLTNIRGWRGAFDFLLGKKIGFLRLVARDWVDYFKPGFHPWDHDNHAFLSQLAEVEAKYTV